MFRDGYRKICVISFTTTCWNKLLNVYGINLWISRLALCVLILIRTSTVKLYVCHFFVLRMMIACVFVHVDLLRYQF